MSPTPILPYLYIFFWVEDELQGKGKGKGKTWKQNHKQIIQMKGVFFFTFDLVFVHYDFN